MNPWGNVNREKVDLLSVQAVEPERSRIDELSKRARDDAEAFDRDLARALHLSLNENVLTEHQTPQADMDYSYALELEQKLRVEAHAAERLSESKIKSVGAKDLVGTFVSTPSNDDDEVVTCAAPAIDKSKPPWPTRDVERVGQGGDRAIVTKHDASITTARNVRALDEVVHANVGDLYDLGSAPRVSNAAVNALRKKKI